LSDPRLTLPFDQYQRYRLVADILEELRPQGERLVLLDVGGRTALLRLFLPADEVHLVDVEASEAQGLVLGDGSCLPYLTDSVDAVVAFDTLEHVPPSQRAALIKECRRVARRWVVLAGPYDTEGVALAEEHLTAFLREKMGTEHRYLAEHASNGLPNLAETEEALAGSDAKVMSIGHANLQRWLALMCLELYMDRDAPLRAMAARAFEFYNSALYASDHATPVYRHAVVAALGDAPLPSEKVLPEPPVAPAGSLAGFQNLIEELLRFDVERDVVTREWDRLEKVNADLHLDLDGHKETLCILQESNAEQKKVIEELKASAVLVIGEVDALLAEVDLLKETLAGERQERDEVIKTFEVDLQGHRSLLAEKAAEVEQLRREQVAVVEAFEADLAGHREVIATQKAEHESLRAEIAASHEQQATLEATIAEQLARAAELEGTVEQLRGEITGLERVVSDLTATLAERDGTVAELVRLRDELEAHLEERNVTLSEKQSALDIVRGELTGHRRVIDDLQAAQRDRWANLLRALGLK